MSKQALYETLGQTDHASYPFKQEDLGEDMCLIWEVMSGYWKPRFLLDHRARSGVEITSLFEHFLLVDDNDIDWESLRRLPPKVRSRIEWHQNLFPLDIFRYRNGVAEVRWQVNPDGMFYRDSDGYGMTGDQEINLRGAIDREGNVVRKFRLEEE